MKYSKGHRGPEVSRIQALLYELEYDIGVIDGIYGPMTKDAVAQFQQSYMVTGVVDAQTMEIMKQAVAQKRIHINNMLKTPNGLMEIMNTFGKFKFRSTEAGAIAYLDDWASSSIVRVDLPIVGKHSIHIKMKSVFEGVLLDIKSKGLGAEIYQFGCWSPRHKMHNPKRSLSTHAWAIACDINWAENPVGAVGNMNPEIVAIFEMHGFQWGGRWRVRDDMHFQYATGY